MDASHQFFPYSACNNYPAANIDSPQLFPYPTPSTSNNYPAVVMDAPQLSQHYYSSMHSNSSPAAEMNLPHQTYATSCSNYESRPRISELLPVIPKIFPAAVSYDDTAAIDASLLSPQEFPQPTQFPNIVRPVARYADAPLYDSDDSSDHEQESEENQEELPYIDSVSSFECRWKSCNQKFTVHEEFVDHVNKAHVNVDKDEFICEWDGCMREEPFVKTRLLGAHVRQHTGDKPHKCQFPDCERAYGRLENLKTHIRTHTGERPYKCSQPGCGKTFNNASDRAKHQNRTHSDEKSYQCPIEVCEKWYTDPSSLRKHIKRVHGDDAYDKARKKNRANCGHHSKFRKRKGDGSADLPQIDQIGPQFAKLKEARRKRKIQPRQQIRKMTAVFKENASEEDALKLQIRGMTEEKTGDGAPLGINASVDLEDLEVHRKSVLTVLDYFNQAGTNKVKTFVNEIHVSAFKNVVRVEDRENTNSDYLSSLKNMCQVLSENGTLNEQRTYHIPPKEIVDELPKSTNFPPKIITRNSHDSLAEQEAEANQEELPHIHGVTSLQCRWNSCLKTFTAHEALADHVQAVHFNVDKEFVCKWDGCERKQAFRTIARLSPHVKRHTLDKPNKCQPQRAQGRRKARNAILEENSREESTSQLQSASEKMDQTIEACCSSTKPWNGDDVLRSDGSAVLENIEFHRKSVLTVLDYFKQAESSRDKKIVAKIPVSKVEIEAKLNVLREKERKKILSKGIKQLKRMRRLMSKKEIVTELPNTSNTITCSLPEQEGAANQEQLPHIHGATSLQCRWNSCLKTFTVYEALVDHLLTVHVNVDKGHKEFICKWEDCGQPFRTINGIRLHIGRHISDKPHRCKFPGCYSAFSLLEPLRAHVRRTHIDMYERTKNERPICNKKIVNEIQVSNGKNGAHLHMVQEGENCLSEDPKSLKRILSERCTLYEQRSCHNDVVPDVPSTSSCAPKAFTGKGVDSSPEERTEEIREKMPHASGVTSFECGSNSASEKCTVDKVQDVDAKAARFGAPLQVLQNECQDRRITISKAH